MVDGLAGQGERSSVVTDRGATRYGDRVQVDALAIVHRGEEAGDRSYR